MKPKNSDARWLLADLFLIIAFAATGRTTHESGMAILGILGTAAVASLLADRRDSPDVPTG